MAVLVAAASERGATAKIAAWIGAGLTANGVDVDVRKLDEVENVERYDTFVLGSAVYLGQWLKTARSFVDAHVGELDHLDRAAVDEWAATIARELQQLKPDSRRIHHAHRVQPTQ